MKNWQIAILHFALAFGLILCAVMNWSAAERNPAVGALFMFGLLVFSIGLSGLVHWYFMG